MPNLLCQLGRLVPCAPLGLVWQEWCVPDDRVHRWYCVLSRTKTSRLSRQTKDCHSLRLRLFSGDFSRRLLSARGVADAAGRKEERRKE